jgi:chromate reductase
MRVLGLSGSLRRDSHNTALLRAAGRLLPDGAELVVFEGLGDLPPFDQDVEDAPEVPLAVARLREAIAGADALLVATPEYNHSIPGVLKNALDWASRPRRTSVMRGKTVAAVGASTGMFGAAWAQADLRRVLGATGARVVDAGLGVPGAADAFGAHGDLADPALAVELRGVLDALLAETRVPVAA